MFQLKLGSARGVSQHTAYIWATVINTFLVLCTYCAALVQGREMSPV